MDDFQKELLNDLRKENTRLQNVCNQQVFERYYENKTEISTNTDLKEIRNVEVNTERKKFCDKGTMTDINEIDGNVPKLKDSIQNSEKDILELSKKLHKANIFTKNNFKRKIREEVHFKMENLGKLCEILG